MLTGSEILRCVENGDIIISPFNKKQINPNSYNLRIGNTLKIYDFSKQYALDPKERNPTFEIEIPEEGYILEPNRLYLASTVERTFTDKFIPCISGRSSYARLGLEVHQTAGFGDIGVDLNWTLELHVIHPVIIYPNLEICQIYFEKPDGDTEIKYDGKYNHQRDIISSKSFLDFR